MPQRQLSKAERERQCSTQCSASRGPKLGRCPNDATTLYAQQQQHGDTTRTVWVKRCDEHPMRTHAGIAPLGGGDL